jgi:pimeloyl-ACP methyl ester carboxylesterase
MTAPMTLPKHPIHTEFVEAGGMRFETNMCGDESSDALALCLHGFPEHSFSWRYQLPVLAELGYRAWAPNQRGYGRTTRPKEQSEYHRDKLIADVAALIDVAGAKSVTLLVHDWGGIIGWLFALEHVRPIDRLVVMNIPHPQRFHEALQTPEQKKKSRYERFFQLPWLPEALFKARGARAVGEAFRGMAVDKSRFPDDVTDVYRQHALEPGAMTAMLNWYRANPFRKVTAGDWPVLDTPTLMIWGDHDAALGTEMTAGTEKLVSDFTLRKVRASHWVQQEAPEAVNEILTAWLRGEAVPDPG